MMAVMLFAATASETRSIAWRVTLYQALTSRARMPAPSSSTTAVCGGGAG